MILFYHKVFIVATLFSLFLTADASFKDVEPKNGSYVVLQQKAHVEYIKDKIEKKNRGLWNGVIAERNTSPEKIKLVWQCDTICSKYIIELSMDKTFSSSKRFFSQINSLEVENLLLDTKYYWRVIANKMVSPVYTFTTNSTPPRWIHVPGIANVRDIGTWSADLGRIRQGMVYRGTRMDKLPHLITKEGLDVVLNDLGLKSELDLRSAPKGPPPLKKAGLKVIYAGIGSYSELLKNPVQKEKVAQTLRHFTDIKFYPVYVHCDGGADRTGCLIMFLQAILGTSDEDMLLDYELTSFFETRSRESRQMKPFLAELQKYGSNSESLSVKIRRYLIECGLTDLEQQQIRKILCEKK